MALQEIKKDAQGIPTGLYGLIAGATLWADAPIGVINAFGGADAPKGWILCQGQAISRTDYADLFAVIGTAFGSGDGSTTFNVPDFQGKTLAGYHSSETEFNLLGKTGGIKSNTLEANQIPSLSGISGSTTSGEGAHSHSYSAVSPLGPASPSSNSTAATQVTGASSGGAHTHTFANGAYTNNSQQSVDNLQPYATVNFIIKAKQTPLPADIAEGLEALLAEKSYLAFE